MPFGFATGSGAVAASLHFPTTPLSPTFLSLPCSPFFVPHVSKCSKAQSLKGASFVWRASGNSLRSGSGDDLCWGQWWVQGVLSQKVLGLAGIVVCDSGQSGNWKPLKA